jgi:hypothetical protein
MTESAIAQRRDKLRQKLAADLEALDREERIRAALPPDLAALDLMVHTHGLYGTAGAVHFKYARHYRPDDAPRPATLADALQLAQAFPAIERAVYRDGCVSIRERTALPAEGRGQVTWIAPLTVTIAPADFDQTLRAEWSAQLGPDALRIVFEFPLYGPEARALGRLDLLVKRYAGGHGDVASIERNVWHVADPLRVIGDCTARQIRYAAGDHRTPGDHCIYWEGSHEATQTTLVQQLEAWIGHVGAVDKGGQL